MNLAAGILLGIITVLILTSPVQYWVKLGLIAIMFFFVSRGWGE